MVEAEYYRTVYLAMKYPSFTISFAIQVACMLFHIKTHITTIMFHADSLLSITEEIKIAQVSLWIIHN